ncbi:MAG TPA: 50S ribosomal protein L11 methyltransferase [Candidatus Coproplasma stercoripullorum]|uniref:Ribosomal protein L11 methyltransferase n=1 Tax=Candidatus Coproplasma stercoripullorum TaxID=2840751 RepID=A0A9D1AG67_9FIRM|nr:50S ribosomal protein L11 methyltransferase [Candidatus Coproplasma stercoripullorum]
MKFTEVTVHTTSEGSELVADILWRYSNYGVAISDVKDVIALQRDKVMYWDYMDEDLTRDTGEALVKAFVTVEDTPVYMPQIRADIEEMKENCAGCMPLGSLEITTRTVEGDDWIEIWRKHFRPIHIGSRVVVVPEWIKYEKQPQEVTVRLDSNMAFGTGEHETTAMCLELLQEYLTPESVCLDVGCGSGILGISAVLLGAKSAYLTDIDPVATDSAEHNCKLNGVADRCTVKRTDLVGDSEIAADIALANITAEVLCRLAPTLPAHVKSGGTLILSGIIKEKLEGVLQAFAAVGFNHIKTINKGEWYAVAFTKKLCW